MWRRACKRSSREEVYGGGEKSASFLRGIFGLREFLIWLGAVKNVVCERKFLGLLQSAIHSKFCNFNKKTVNIELHNNNCKNAFSPKLFIFQQRFAFLGNNMLRQK